MSRIPLRLRLTAVFAVAMGLVLAALGVVLYTRVADSLDESVDQSLRSRATDLGALIERHGPRLPEAGSRALVESEESFTQLLDSRGSIVDASSRARPRRLLSDEALRDARDGPVTLERDDAVEEGDPARMLATPVAGGLILVVGAATDDNEETLATLRWLLLGGLPIALLLASLAGYWVAAAALRPVETMRRKAAAIGDEKPGERLPVSPAGDELARLGETLNDMLAGLEGALERERNFVADASHELRTPMAILKSELELALREGRSEAELRTALASAAEETDRLSRLADDLLVLARADRGSLALRSEPVAARELLQAVARRGGGDVAIEAPADLTIRGDRLRLEQALGNLLAKRTNTWQRTGPHVGARPRWLGGAARRRRWCRGYCGLRRTRIRALHARRRGADGGGGRARIVDRAGSRGGPRRDGARGRRRLLDRVARLSRLTHLEPVERAPWF